MAQLRNEITSKLDDMETKWLDVHKKTTEKVSTMERYYQTSNTPDAVLKTKDTDKKNLKKDLDEHRDLAAQCAAIKLDLTTQIESSENRLQKMIKYGRLAAVAFALLGALIGGDIGAKVPGLGKIACIVVGRLLGLLVFGLLGFLVYFIMQWRYKKRRNMWKELQKSKEESLELVGFIKEKRSCLDEIRRCLDSIEEDNMPKRRADLLEQMSEYLKDKPKNDGEFNEV